MALGVLMALALATPMALAQVGQGANASGTAKKLAAAWTQWAYSKPVVDSSLIGGYTDADRCDGTPLSPTKHKTWFLAGTSDGSGPAETVRICTMPAETQLFFPVVSVVGFPFPDTDETALSERKAAINLINAVENDPDLDMSVTVDRTEIGTEVERDRIVRARSGPYFTLTLPAGNVVGVREGEYKATADGLWVTLPPLPPGEHTIHFEASAPNVGVSGFFQNNTYILTVG
jgi:hypothetical protein